MRTEDHVDLQSYQKATVQVGKERRSFDRFMTGVIFCPYCRRVIIIGDEIVLPDDQEGCNCCTLYVDAEVIVIPLNAMCDDEYEM